MSKKTDKPKAKPGGRRIPGEGKKIGRPKNPEVPSTANKTFAADVLTQVGSKRWHDFTAARIAYAIYPALLDAWNRQQKVEAEKKSPKLTDPPPQPPHPRDLVRSDADLALYFMCCGDSGIENRTFINFVEKRDGKAMHTVNHLHDKPLEHTVTLELGEGMRQAMELAEKRVSSSRK